MKDIVMKQAKYGISTREYANEDMDKQQCGKWICVPSCMANMKQIITKNQLFKQIKYCISTR